MHNYVTSMLSKLNHYSGINFAKV